MYSEIDAEFKQIGQKFKTRAERDLAEIENSFIDGNDRKDLIKMFNGYISFADELLKFVDTYISKYGYPQYENDTKPEIITSIRNYITNLNKEYLYQLDTYDVTNQDYTIVMENVNREIKYKLEDYWDRQEREYYNYKYNDDDDDYD